MVMVLGRIRKGSAGLEQVPEKIKRATS